MKLWDSKQYFPNTRANEVPNLSFLALVLFVCKSTPAELLTLPLYCRRRNMPLSQSSTR